MTDVDDDWDGDGFDRYGEPDYDDEPDDDRYDEYKDYLAMGYISTRTAVSANLIRPRTRGTTGLRCESGSGGGCATSGDGSAAGCGPSSTTKSRRGR